MESWKKQLAASVSEVYTSGWCDVFVETTSGADRATVASLIQTNLTPLYGGTVNGVKWKGSNKLKFMVDCSGGKDELYEKIRNVISEVNTYAAASNNQETKVVEKETTDTGSTDTGSGSGSSIDLTTIIIVALAAFIIVYFFED